jgi:putative transposase
LEKLMVDPGFSEASRLADRVNRSVWQYEPLREQDDAVREIANERRWFGYRRLAIMLDREAKA